jgi:oxygen-independent coproporphyrinogen-3 oxidase
LCPPDAAALGQLVAKYDKPGPRYTSYPPAPYWSEAFGAGEFAAELARTPREPVSLYVHVPFCQRLCSYCACNRTIPRDRSVVQPYLEGVERELERVAACMGGGRPCAQLAIGGGTPTYLEPNELARLIDAIDAVFDPSPESERSVEIDPRVTTLEHLDVLAERGIRRLSLGVQDFAPRVQHAIRRVQTVEQTARVSEAARARGVRSLNFDLIYGLPFQTLASFDRTLDAVIELSPDRIALYGYAHVTWVSKQQRGFERSDLPDAMARVGLFVRALERLSAAGYLALGLDHFARPTDELARAAARGELHRNFMGYTTRCSASLIGIGPSAISELESAYAQSLREPDDWAARVRSGQLATLRGHRLSQHDVRRAWLIRSLMCRGEIDPADFKSRFADSLDACVPDLAVRLAPFAEDRLLERVGERWRVTGIGRLFLRPMAMSFDAYLAPDLARDRRPDDPVPARFSKLV